ncbi:MAG TPA: hypothetical protein VM491_18335 [Burkholderiaceae bacterium]|nr:hypothetical protein [Burkholderiaceae bacterium]
MSAIEVVDVAQRGAVTLRPVLPQDAPLLAAFVRALSPATRYRRFQGAVNELPESLLQSMTQVDYRRHLALVAESFESGHRLVGEARYVAEPGDRAAQFAITIGDGAPVGRSPLDPVLRRVELALR